MTAGAARRVLFCGLALAGTLSTTASAEQLPPRAAVFEWAPSGRELLVSVSYRDGLDDEIRRKLGRGLPTTIVLLASVEHSGQRTPLSTSVHSCKITWLVWDEAYRIEVSRPEGTRTRWSTTLEGVLRRCAEVSRLLVATASEVPERTPLRLRGRVLVNPFGPEILEKLRAWVSRPARAGAAAPGDALFSTFTGLFMRRVGEAERVLDFVSEDALPRPRGAPGAG